MLRERTLEIIIVQKRVLRSKKVKERRALVLRRLDR